MSLIVVIIILSIIDIINANTPNEVIDAYLCPDATWTFHAETARCFKYNPIADSWTSHSSSCVGYGAHLADPRTAAENTLINSWCYSNGQCAQTVTQIMPPPTVVANPTVPANRPTCCCLNSGPPFSYPTTTSGLFVTSDPTIPPDKGVGTCTPDPAASPVPVVPSFKPTSSPSRSPTHVPSRSPTRLPTIPTGAPISAAPTYKPSGTEAPSRSPSTSKPSRSPSKNPKTPSRAPRTPSKHPTHRPSRSPSHGPSHSPSRAPTPAPAPACKSGGTNGKCCNFGKTAGTTGVNACSPTTVTYTMTSAGKYWSNSITDHLDCQPYTPTAPPSPSSGWVSHFEMIFY
jgi:hypothetical protein